MRTDHRDDRRGSWTVRRAALTAVLLAGALALAGCGSSSGGSGGGSSAPTAGVTASASPTACPTTATTSLAKTKFALHAGLAFGTFHRYIYKPYQAGKFRQGANGRTLALVKAAATATLDYHEIKLAAEDVKADPALCRTLAAPLARLTSVFSSSSKQLTRGDTSGVTNANGLISQIARASTSSGNPITERTS